MIMHRRGFLAGLGALAAPAIIRIPGLLMTVPRTRKTPPLRTWISFDTATIASPRNEAFLIHITITDDGLVQWESWEQST